MRLKNTNPLGDIELHVPDVGSFVLEAGEEFDVPEAAGAALLEQTGNFALVKEPRPRVPAQRSE